MVLSTVGMMAQLCFVEQECLESLDNFYYLSEAKALNSTDNSSYRTRPCRRGAGVRSVLWTVSSDWYRSERTHYNSVSNRA